MDSARALGLESLRASRRTEWGKRVGWGKGIKGYIGDGSGYLRWIYLDMAVLLHLVCIWCGIHEIGRAEVGLIEWKIEQNNGLRVSASAQVESRRVTKQVARC